MIPRPPRSTPKPSSAASDVYKRQVQEPGAYAVLFDPLNVTTPPIWVGVDTLWIADNARLLCLYIVLIFLLVLFITLSLWCVSIQMVEYNSIEKELREYQKMLRDLTGAGTRDVIEGGLTEEQKQENDRRLADLENENIRLREELAHHKTCLLYTSPSPRDQRGSRMPSSA
eukprot:TRINITY_DN9692_c0_g1_i2.p1 TRINITY_DN9692_c0_g1~~TRINITY_DN9692_c0_g1_i2.p1  ORF type:complete len:171 (-),score=71.17 TRINITY_DN9692_c0_g1_i2:10-522(-)